MAFTDYYLGELAYLRELGREFATAHPEMAHMLAETGMDPDVERLLEGFAFLTAQIRRKLDDEFPEIVHTLTELLFPGYLRPFPAVSLLQFAPLPNLLRSRLRIERGTEVDSVPVHGTRCRFRTTQDVDVLPLSLERVTLEFPRPTGGDLRLSFKLQAGAKLATIDLRALRLHLIGGQGLASTLYLWLCERTSGVVLRRPEAAEGGIRLAPSVVSPAGWGANEALLPEVGHAHGAFEILRDYYILPAKFLAIEVGGLERAAEVEADGAFDLVFEMTEPIPGAPRLAPENLPLFVTPVVNLFAHDAEPFRMSHERTEYRVRPAGSTGHYRVYAIEEVAGVVDGQSERRLYSPLVSFRREADQAYYTERLRPAVVGGGADSYVSFSLPPGDDLAIVPETVGIKLLCTNRGLPGGLRAGDISIPTAATPAAVSFRNLTAPTAPVDPPMGGDSHWRLIGHLNLGYRTLADIDALRDVLSLYNFRVREDKQAEAAMRLRLTAIREWRAVPADRLLRGAPVRGTRFEATIDESAFGGEGELYLFARVLNEILAAQATLNTFAELRVTAAGSQNRFAFAPRTLGAPDGGAW